MTTTASPAPRYAHPATPSYAYATPANQCEYAGHAWDSLTVSQLQDAVLRLPFTGTRGDYYAALAAWEGRAAELAARGLDYYADDAWWEASTANRVGSSRGTLAPPRQPVVAQPSPPSR